MIKHFLIIILFVNITVAQNTLRNNKNTDESNTITKSLIYSNSSLINESNEVDKKYPERFIENLEIKFYQTGKSREKYSFDLMSSVGNNINFGGFWDKYAVVNFTPQLFIRPAGFLSIYANHHLNCLIPVDGIKEYSQSLILQSISVLAVDNSMKLFFNSNIHWIAEVISFTAKNLLMNILIKPVISNSVNSPSPILQYENYYYSMSIAF